MNIRFATEKEIASWDRLVLANPDGGNIIQGATLASIKSQGTWKVRYIVTSTCAITMLEKNIPSLGKLWYAPKGPGISDIEQLKDTVSELKSFARSNGVFLLKVEPELEKSAKNVATLGKLGHFAGAIQPNSTTVYIHIKKDTAKMLAEVSQKTRHAINRARREGLVVKNLEPTDANLKTMLSLLHSTMSDKKVVMREDSYYLNFWKTFIDKNQGALFVAYDGKKPIAGAFIMLYGKKALYKDGGSVREKTIYGASHALQWSIVEWLAERNFKSYDLCGTPPISELSNTNHPHYGIGLFKTSFNKEATEFVGVYDIVINQAKYKLWVKFIEKLTHKYHSAVLKKLFY